MRIYADKQEVGAYFLIFSDQVGIRGHEALANVYPGSEPSLVGTSIGRDYFSRTWPKRVDWSDLPEEWQEAFVEYLSRGEDTPFDPASVRGLWRVGNQPKPVRV
jgi:hypothetical protein